VILHAQLENVHKEIMHQDVLNVQEVYICWLVVVLLQIYVQMLVH